MDNKQFAKELEKRTREFAVRIIRLSTRLPNTPEGRVIRNQITKSGTSIGANYREANRARSRADFKNKIDICESEAGVNHSCWQWENPCPSATYLALGKRCQVSGFRCQDRETWRAETWNLNTDTSQLNSITNNLDLHPSEASETQYWLEVVTEVEWLSWEQLKPEYEECSELLAIFTSIGKK